MSDLPDIAPIRSMLEIEQHRDRLVRRVSLAGWIGTFVVLAGYAGIVGADVLRTWRMVQVGAAPRGAIFDALVPLLAAAGGLSLFVAVVATVGVFLRFRTASLGDIQLRLAILESMISGRD